QAAPRSSALRRPAPRPRSPAAPGVHPSNACASHRLASVSPCACVRCPPPPHPATDSPPQSAPSPLPRVVADLPPLGSLRAGSCLCSRRPSGRPFGRLLPSTLLSPNRRPLRMISSRMVGGDHISAYEDATSARRLLCS